MQDGDTLNIPASDSTAQHQAAPKATATELRTNSAADSSTSMATIINHIKDHVSSYLIGAVVTLLFATSSQLYDGGFLARIMGATPKWRSVDLSDINYFDPACEYRYEISNQERTLDVPDVMGLGRPTFFYPHNINQDSLVSSYDTVTMGISYTQKTVIHVKYRVMKNWIPTGEIGSREWPTLLLQRRCP